MSFTPEETQMLINLLQDNLEVYEQTLKDELEEYEDTPDKHTSLAATMAVYDAAPAVTAFMKIDPEGMALRREEARLFIAEFYET